MLKSEGSSGSFSFFLPEPAVQRCRLILLVYLYSGVKALQYLLSYTGGQFFYIFCPLVFLFMRRRSTYVITSSQLKVEISYANLFLGPPTHPILLSLSWFKSDPWFCNPLNSSYLSKLPVITKRRQLLPKAIFLLKDHPIPVFYFLTSHSWFDLM